MGRGGVGAAVRAVALLFAYAAAGACAGEPPQQEDEPPRVLALLKHAWAAESGRGDALDPRLALRLYCQAGSAGSPEGYFRLGLLLIDGPAGIRDAGKGRGYLALAAQLGHERAAVLLADAPAAAPRQSDCASFGPPLRRRLSRPTGSFTGIPYAETIPAPSAISACSRPYLRSTRDGGASA